MEGEEKVTRLAVVRSVAGKGRGVVATSYIPRGTLIMAEPAAAASLGRPDLCSHCFTTLDKEPVVCSTCDKATYCTQTCKTAAWDHVHWMECGAGREALVGVQGGLYNLSLRLFLATPPHLRHLWEQPVSPALDSPDDLELGSLLHQPHLYWALVASLPRHKKEVRNMEGYNRIIKAVSDCAKAIVASGRAKSLRRTKKQLKRAMEVTYCNTFHIYTGSAPTISNMAGEEEAGSGLYSVASLFNHSCLPNTTRTFSETTMYLRVITDVEPGEELVITYGVDVKNEPTSLRRETLENWSFRCACVEACGNRDWRRREALFWGLACPLCQLGPAIAEKEDLAWLHCLATPPSKPVPIRCLDCGGTSALSPAATAELMEGLAVVRGEEPYRSDLSHLLRRLHPGNHSALRGAWTAALARCTPERRLDEEALDALEAVHHSMGAFHRGFHHFDVAEDASAALQLLQSHPPHPEAASRHSLITQQLFQEISDVFLAHYGPCYALSDPI